MTLLTIFTLYQEVVHSNAIMKLIFLKDVSRRDKLCSRKEYQRFHCSCTIFNACVIILLKYLFSVLDADFPYKKVSIQRLKGHIDSRYIVCEQVGQ